MTRTQSMRTLSALGAVASIPALVSLARAGEPAAKAPLAVESRIVAVTVMPDRAAVTRRFEADFPEGRASVVIDGLLPGLDERTVACLPAPGTEGARAADVSSEVYERAAPIRADLADLEAERRKLGLDIRAVEDEIVALKERGRVLGEYRTLTSRAMKLGLAAGGDGAPAPDTASWKKAVDYVSAQAHATTKRIREAETRKFRLTEKARELDAKIAAVKNPSRGRARRARVAVDCATAGRKAFDLSYVVVGNVRWGPRYEARLARADVRDAGLRTGQLALTALAAVAQETGEDWTGAKITFSTRVPAKGLAPPEVEAVVLVAMERTTKASSLASVEVEEDDPLTEREQAPATGLGPYEKAGASPPGVGPPPASAPKAAHLIAGIRPGGEAVEFVAYERVTVRSDGKPVTVSLGRWEPGCAWRLEAVPKLLGSVYVRADLANPTGGVMLAGPCECYLDGEYVGRMEVPATAAGARVAVSFGAAEGLSVTRTAESLGKRKRRGAERGRRYDYAYTIELANSTDEVAEVAVLENVPVSRVGAVAVEVSRDTTPHETLDGGRLLWHVALAPGERKAIRFGYTVAISKGYGY